MDATKLPHISEMVQPADQAAVAETVRNAASKGEAVYPIGGGTMLDYGGKPARQGVGLSMANLNRTIDYPAADMTITVEAGMTIAELNRLLAVQRQRLPVDVPQPERATVGGAMAVGAAGPRRYAYGTMRDYVLGLTAVDGAGTVFNGGGRVVKNAAGYNMCRLMVGSLGTLGIVTQATLMVRPMCEASVFLACEAPDFDVAERLLADLVCSPTRPTAIEFVAGRRQESELVLGPMLAGNVGRLYVGFEGAAADVDWMVGELRGRWNQLGATEPMLVPTSRAEPLWRWLTDFVGDVQISVLPSRTVETIAKALQIESVCAIHAHAGDGVIHVRLEGNGTEDDEGRGVSGGSGLKICRAFAAVAPLRELTAAMGGRMVVRRPIDGVQWTSAEIWGEPGPEIRIMRAIRERFDPQKVLNPGRFVY